MNNIDTYLEYYGNQSFNTHPFNDIDNIIFTTFAYLPIKINFEESKTVKQIIDLIKDSKILGRSAKNAVKLLNQIENLNRYKEIKFRNYISVVNENTQFCAITITFDSSCYVAFKGTDNTLIGWKENFELLYTYPTNAQLLASNYLNQTIKNTDEIIYVGGHSKGGNLAMASVMETTPKIYRKIKQIYNNDGPGFLKEQFLSANFQKIKPKLKNIIPEESMVGILLYNDNYQVVKSSAQAIAGHFPSTWQCFGSFLVKSSLSNPNRKIEEKVRTYIESTTLENRKKVIEEFFDILAESGIKEFKELKDLKPSEINDMISKIKNIDEQSKEMIMLTGKIFLGMNQKNKE